MHFTIRTFIGASFGFSSLALATACGGHGTGTWGDGVGGGSPGSSAATGGASASPPGGAAPLGGGAGGATEPLATGGTAAVSPRPVDGLTPVERWGQLRVEGTALVDASGNPVQLKGASSMWLNWESDGYAESLEGVRWMRDNWRLSVIRAAMGIDPEGAYLEDPDKAKGQVRNIVDNAIELGLYVIIDWHDHEAATRQADAQEFFLEMATEYGSTPNVLYETFNEPLQVSWSDVVKPYHEAILSTIRSVDADNIVVLGTPNWSQFVDEASRAPVVGTNLMYTLHFYSCSHTASLRRRGDTAIAAGLALFVTEWGATHSDGGTDGLVCLDEAQAWHDWIDTNGISWTAWKFDNCEDSTCYFPSTGASVDGGWTDANLHGHGPFVRDRMID